MHEHNDPSSNEEDEDFKSKTDLKREAHALQELGRTLVELTPNDLKRVSMPEDLERAVMAARKMHQRGALKRQLQFIGKVMRKIDAEPVQASYNALLQRDQLANARFHRLEALRDRLIANDDNAIEDALNAIPGLDRQHLRQVVRNAQKELKNGKPPSSSRALFKYLREMAEPE